MRYIINVFKKKDFDENEKFDPKILPQGYLLNPKEGQAFVYVCTIQRMMINLFGRSAFTMGDEEADEDAKKEDIPIHAFDVIIADECHRGYTTRADSDWRATLDHFDAIKNGYHGSFEKFQLPGTSRKISTGFQNLFKSV